MTTRASGRASVSTVDTRTAFTFRVVHGADPSRKSNEHKATTKTLSVSGLIFEIPAVDVDGFHISFTEASFGRNFLEITLELGKKLPSINLLGQVEWYEHRPTPKGFIFIVGVSFVDIQPDAVFNLKQYINMIRGLSRDRPL